MPQRGMTVTEHIILGMRAHPEATGAFAQLLSALVTAAKIISSEVNRAGLTDILGSAGVINVQGEEVQKMDEFAEKTIIRHLVRTGQVCAMVSEETADIIPIPDRYPKGKYILVFDPLDGSSNIDVNVSIGTIFSILKKEGPGNDVTIQDVLQPGRKQVAAGYFIYGSSTMMVYTTGEGAHGFTYMPEAGEFFLSHPDIRTPEEGKIYSVNEGYYNYWEDNMKELVDYIKTPEPGRRTPSDRYIGSLVADFHRNLFKGGLFMYPSNLRDPKMPTGKLRLMCECNPLAFVVEQAGGRATDGKRNILDIEPQEIHQRVPFFIGSPRNVEIVEEFLKD